MNSAVGTSAASLAQSPGCVGGAHSGGGDGRQHEGGTDASSSKQCREPGVSSGGWRPLSVTDSTASRPRLVDAVGREVSAVASGRYLGPKFFASAGLVPTSEEPMDLLTLVTAAIVSLRPAISGEMLDKYAGDIAGAVETVCGNDNRCADLALALVVVQDAESTWRESVATCKVIGDGGRAHGSFQLHRHWWRGHSAKEVCGSNRLGAELAANALTVLSRRGGLDAGLRLYVGCGWGDKRAVRRRATLRRLRALPEVQSFRVEAAA